MIRANVLDRFLDPFGAFLTPEVAQKLVDFRVDEQTQARIDELADKCNEGQLTLAEREEYDTDTVIDIYNPVGPEECAEEARYGIIRTSTSVVPPSTWPKDVRHVVAPSCPGACA